MASGKLGSAAIPATTYTTLFQATAGKVTTFNLNLCNTSGNAITVRFSIAAANPPVDGEHMEYEANVPSNGVLERTALVASGGEYIIIYASATGINARAYGFEQ